MCGPLRGMSRKVLARVSGISERYIAQLESGKGNVSIKLLRRVSGAMGTRIEDLIIDPTVPPDWPVFRDLIRTAGSARIAQARAILAGAATAARSRRHRSGRPDRLARAGKSTLGRAQRRAWAGPLSSSTRRSSVRTDIRSRRSWRSMARRATSREQAALRDVAAVRDR